jgi:hypothetical protein
VPGVAEEGYSVEFFDMPGNRVAVVTVLASVLRLPTSADRPAAHSQRVIPLASPAASMLLTFETA